VGPREIDRRADEAGVAGPPSEDRGRGELSSKGCGTCKALQPQTYGGSRIDFPYRRIVSLKTDILIRESFLLKLNFPLFYGKI